MFILQVFKFKLCYMCIIAVLLKCRLVVISVLIVSSESLSSGTSNRRELDSTVQRSINWLSGRWRLHVPGAQVHSFAEGWL